MKILFSLFFLAAAVSVSGQTQLTISGKTYTNSEDTWLGVNIPRSEPTKLVFKNNSISSINRYGYLLQAGDESVKPTINNLDGAIITGNKLSWSGSDMTVIPHGIFTGHNKNVLIKYNYLRDVPMGIIRKSANNMTNTSGGVAYNIVKSGTVGMVIKGMSNVNVFNNTFYQARTTSQTWRPLLHIYTNTDGENYSVAHGTKIYNNIFYTKYQTYAITIADNESLQGLECDYNIYWCENGSPRFNVAGSTKTFEQWQAMGYDRHSVVMNPQFKDFVNFVPEKRLDHGKDLGSEWRDGLAVNAVWGTSDPAMTPQNGTWQVGAVIHAADVTTPPVPVQGPEYVSSVVTNAAPSAIAITYNSTLAVIVPAAAAFTVHVNSVVRNVTGVSISDDKVILDLQQPVINGDVVTVSYVIPSANPLQNTAGGVAVSFSLKPVTNSVEAVVTPAPSEPEPVDPVPAPGGNEPAPVDSNLPEKITVASNIVRDTLNINIENPKNVDKTLKIFDFTGKLCLEKQLTQTVEQSINLQLNSGFYVMRLVSGSDTLLLQKLIVVD